MFALATVRRLTVVLTLVGLVGACAPGAGSVPSVGVAQSPSPTVPTVASLAPTPSATAMPVGALTVTVSGLTGARGSQLIGALAVRDPEYKCFGMFSVQVDADPYLTTQLIRERKQVGEPISGLWPWLRKEAVVVSPGSYDVSIYVGRDMGPYTECEPGPDEVDFYCRTVFTKVDDRDATVTVGPPPPTTGRFYDLNTPCPAP